MLISVDTLDMSNELTIGMFLKVSVSVSHSEDSKFYLFEAVVRVCNHGVDRFFLNRVFQQFLGIFFHWLILK
jgi:hypothetical protein